MSDEQTNFKVTDRRLFNSDGTPRDVPEDERPTIKLETPKPETPAVASSAEASAAPAAAAPTPATGSEVNAAPASAAVSAPAAQQPGVASEATYATETSETAEAGAEVEIPDAEDPASFANFMMSIASNAAASLGMMEHPATGKREVDLDLGRHWIDVLGMLQQKTRGNLLPQEQQILEGLLADLRMQYVSLTNATPKARTYTSRDITGG
jgi:hypothetical protein